MYVILIHMPQFSVSWLAITGAIAGVISAGIFLASLAGNPTAMFLSPEAGIIETGKEIVVSVHVTSKTPVNVFKGIVRFSPEHLVIEKIDYNTSIANLWAEEPWYSNGDGLCLLLVEQHRKEVSLEKGHLSP